MGGKRLSVVKFLHNDYVEILSGQHAGETGSVVWIQNYPSEHEVEYIIETEKSGDVIVCETELREHEGYGDT